MSRNYTTQQPFTIINVPTLVNKERVYPNKGTIITDANSSYYKMEMTHTSSVSKISGIIAIACGIWFLSSDDIGKEENFFYAIFSALVLLAGLFFFIYGLAAKKENKMFILHRLNGTVSYPDLFYFPPLKGKFKDLKAVISVSGDIDGVAGREYLKFVNTFRPRKLDLLRTITYDDPYKEWSLYVWYMDKNRPLPPGTAFDPYREQDFERRKKLGFPRPLYPSNIDTPEATPEQQAQRRLIGGW